jgi:hypothetical protein
MMTTIYKLTDSKGRTRPGRENELQWAEGTEHVAPGNGDLCSNAYIHGYVHPLLAVFFDPIHGDYGPEALLWEADADVKKNDGTKLGCTRVRMLRRVPLPELSVVVRARVAIVVALEVNERAETYRAWADAWLSGEDRSELAAKAVAAASWAAALACHRAVAAARWAAEGGAGAAASWAVAGRLGAERLVEIIEEAMAAEAVGGE